MTDDEAVRKIVQRKLEAERRDALPQQTRPEKPPTFLKRNWMLIAGAVVIGVVIGGAIFLNVQEEAVPDELNREIIVPEDTGEGDEGRLYESDSVRIRLPHLRRETKEMPEEEEDRRAPPAGGGNDY
jgi:hypothetical protein